MVWKLSDLSLKCVEQNLVQYPDLANLLPNRFKETLIERLANHDHFFPENWLHISKSLFTGSLRNIHLHGCEQITDRVLQLLAASNWRLEVLTLKWLNNVTDLGVMAVTTGQKDLLLVELVNLPLITQKVLWCIDAPNMWSFSLVQSLSTAKSWSLAASNLSSFLWRNRSIRVLNINLEAGSIPVIAQNLNHSLEELKSQLQTLTDEDIESLAHFCPNLQKLDLNGAKFVGKESLIKLFQACTKIQELDLSYCSRLASPPECEVLWTLPQSLTFLSLCGLMLEDGDILVEAVTRLPSLTSIKLCGVPALTDDTLTRIMEKIGHRLTDVNLSGIGSQEMTDAGVGSVATYCTALKSLQISLMFRVSGVTLLLIFASPDRARRIQKLALNCKLMDASTLHQIVGSCPNLEVLYLPGLSLVTNEMITTLADHSPKLRDLDLNGCKQVTDAAICYLSRSCPLTSLCLSGLHTLTDKSIFSLASSCPQLEEIYLNGCSQVSPVAVQYLKDCCLGRLFAKHNVPNASPNQLMAKNLDTGEYCRADLL